MQMGEISPNHKLHALPTHYPSKKGLVAGWLRGSDVVEVIMQTNP